MGKTNTKRVDGGQLDELFALYDKHDLISKEVSEAIVTAKLNSDNKILINRDGKEVEITEKDAWDEVRVLARNTECYEILKNKYPECFAKSEQSVLVAKEIDTLAVKLFGITSATRITLRDIIKVCLSLRNIE